MATSRRFVCMTSAPINIVSQPCVLSTLTCCASVFKIKTHTAKVRIWMAFHVRQKKSHFVENYYYIIMAWYMRARKKKTNYVPFILHRVCRECQFQHRDTSHVRRILAPVRVAKAIPSKAHKYWFRTVFERLRVQTFWLIMITIYNHRPKVTSPVHISIHVFHLQSHKIVDYFVERVIKHHQTIVRKCTLFNF